MKNELYKRMFGRVPESTIDLIEMILENRTKEDDAQEDGVCDIDFADADIEDESLTIVIIGRLEAQSSDSTPENVIDGMVERPESNSFCDWCFDGRITVQDEDCNVVNEFTADGIKVFSLKKAA